MLQWTPEMSVGHESLDDDHKAFFSVASLLFDMSNEGGQELVIESAFNLLQDYVSGHFLREEMAMRSANYPDLDAHIALHVRFADQVRSMIADYHAGNAAVTAELGVLTADWLGQHIRDVDKKYAAWVKDTDIDDRPLGLIAAVDDDGADEDFMTFF